jgi:hypothetical protein
VVGDYLTLTFSTGISSFQSEKVNRLQRQSPPILVVELIGIAESNPDPGRQNDLGLLTAKNKCDAPHLKIPSHVGDGASIANHRTA